MGVRSKLSAERLTVSAYYKTKSQNPTYIQIVDDSVTAYQSIGKKRVLVSGTEIYDLAWLG
jgi:hypothetical protein